MQYIKHIIKLYDVVCVLNVRLFAKYLKCLAKKLFQAGTGKCDTYTYACQDCTKKWQI